jgi:hypothetical protein
MRTLKFIVENQTLIKDPATSFDGLFPAPNQKVRAEFVFSDNWGHVPKVVAFYSMMGKEYSPQVVDKNNGCLIPPEALLLPTFKIQILGNFRGKIITTNELTIYQKGGRV